MKTIGPMIALVLLPLIAAAHGRSLSLNTMQARPGESIMLKGEEMGDNMSAKVVLEGILDTYELGTAQTAANGDLEASVVIPADVPPGAYTLKVQAGSASVSAPLKISLSKPVGEAQEEASRPDDHDEDEGEAHAETPSHDEASESVADSHDEGDAHEEGEEEDGRISAEPMSLDRSMSAGEAVAVWGLILITAFAGAFLLYRRT